MGWGDNVKKRLQQQHQAVNDKIIDNFEVLATFAVSFSPTKPDAEFAKGLFKNSWYVAINEFDMSVGSVADSSGSASMARIKSLKGSRAFVSKDGYLSLTNNIPYAARIEYLGWPAGEGANGWVWSGRVGPYSPLRNAIISYKGYSK